MSVIDQHPILGQLAEADRRDTTLASLQQALAERRCIMERDGKLTTIAAGFICISGLFFMQTLPFFLVLALLVIGLPLVWRHLIKEAREFSMTDVEIEDVLRQADTNTADERA